MSKPEKTKKSSKPDSVLKLKLVRSLIGTTLRQRETARALGLRRIRQTVEREDTPAIRGMVAVVAHLIEVVEG